MKKLVLILTTIILVSCGPLNKVTIQQRLLTQSPVRYDTTHYDAQNKPTPVYDSIYVISPSKRMAWRKSTSDTKATFIGGVIVSAGAFVLAGHEANIGHPYVMLGYGAISIVGLAIAGDAMEWNYWNSDREITKSDYDSVKNAGGDFSYLWKTN